VARFLANNDFQVLHKAFRQRFHPRGRLEACCRQRRLLGTL
jgi:hypothetical protein